ncbi:MAG: histidinol dehydrogenase, partial [Burkholderiales bacterium]
MSPVRRLSTRQADFEDRFAELLAFEATQDEGVETAVAAVLAAVRARGDAAVLEYTRRFDGVQSDSMAALELAPDALASAAASLTEPQRAALE